MFSGWFKPGDMPMTAFERQFGEENGMLVYRRHGKGPAYRVSDVQREAMIDRYVRDHRIRSMAMTVGFVLLTLGLTGFVAFGGIERNDAILGWTLGLSVALMTAWFAWASYRGALRLEKDLTRYSPVAAALSTDGAMQRVLSQVSYGTLASLPLFGLAAVFVGAMYFDVWTGWGRLVWLVPAAFAVQAARQALRKFRLGRDRF